MASTSKPESKPERAAVPAKPPTLTINLVSVNKQKEKVHRDSIHERPRRPREKDVVQTEAPWWNYALLHRERWRKSRALSVAQQWRAALLWEALFEPASAAKQPAARAIERSSALDRLDRMPGTEGDCHARHGQPLPDMIEVQIRFERESAHWAYRVIPWEFVLSSVIKGRRPYEMNDAQRVPIVRRIAWDDEVTVPRLSDQPLQWRVMIVLSAPGFISRIYKLDSEIGVVMESGLLRGLRDKLKKEKVEMAHVCYLWNPKWDELKAQIEAFQPDIVHFAGCDTHQAMAVPDSGDYSEYESQAMRIQMGQVLLNDPRQEALEAEVLTQDGYCLLHPDATHMQGIGSGIECVPYQRLSALFDQHKPALVCWNLYHSGNRTAAMSVAMGKAGASVGFQDFIDDEVAEEYFEEFYAALVHTGGKVAVAHAIALRAVWRLAESVRGAGIVLWTGYDALSEIDAETAAKIAANVPERQDLVTPVADKNVRFFVDVPKDGLNYARLHQNQSPFRRFRIFIDKPYKLRDVEIKARINGDDRDLVWRKRLTLESPFVDLAPEIAFPLTSALARSCRESVVTTFHVQVTHGTTVLLSRTYQTRILPPDQWNFSVHSAHTLASFVFPRDPAVERLILASQKNMRVLRDDALAGFEGYQAETPEEVDLQVQAIWATLLHDYRLGYINPPPAYSRASDSQRLRTPSMVLNGGWGTCIDLALLLAAAFELVDIYPVIIVLKAHAFVGYWRSVEARHAFLQVNDADWMTRNHNQWDFVPRKPVNGMFMTGSLHEVRHHVEMGHLVLLESTYLTSLDSFLGATDAGRAHLEVEEDFEYMIDLVSARVAGITPLPLLPDGPERRAA